MRSSTSTATSPIRPTIIPALRRILESGVDVVNAARTRTRPEAMPLPNYLANRSFALLAQMTAGAKVSDLHSGMRGYRSSVIRAFAFDGEGDAHPHRHAALAGQMRLPRGGGAHPLPRARRILQAAQSGGNGVDFHSLGQDAEDG